MYTIEKGVPIPTDAKQTKYPFMEMEVGCSFAAPKEQANTIRAAAAYYRRRHKMQFLIRPDTKDEEKVRIWRTA